MTLEQIGQLAAGNRWATLTLTELHAVRARIQRGQLWLDAKDPMDIFTNERSRLVTIEIAVLTEINRRLL